MVGEKKIAQFPEVIQTPYLLPKVIQNKTHSIKTKTFPAHRK